MQIIHVFHSSLSLVTIAVYLAMNFLYFKYRKAFFHTNTDNNNWHYFDSCSFQSSL